MDTTHIAYTAEDLIAHILQKNVLLVAKPKFDQDGTDLITFLTVKDGAKFGRIQCKGRSLINNRQTNIKIPKQYVIGAFFLFLYLDIGNDENYLFLFFANDIKKWKINQKEQYVLNIYKKWFLPQSKENPLNTFSFKREKITCLKNLIEKTSSAQEKQMWDIIKKQQKLQKISAIKHRLDGLNSEIKHIETNKTLLDENIKLQGEKGKLISKELFSKISPNIISYAKKLKTRKIKKLEAISLVKSNFKNKHEKIDELELMVRLIYGEYPNCFKNKLITKQST